MALSEVEKCAGREFRAMAEKLLARQLLDNPDSAACSLDVTRYRHDCAEQAGRTKSIILRDFEVLSPEIWVVWDSGPRVLTEQEAREMVEGGLPLQYEILMKDKFVFTWKQGKCDKCGLFAISREGRLRDNRPYAEPAGDLGTFVAGMQLHRTKALMREHEVES